MEAIFELMQKQGAQGLLILPGALTWTTRQKITDLALAYRLPSGNFFREAVAAGGLISPGPNYVDMLSQVAKYVHRILKGAKTADLPVEQPTRFETWINLKTAKTLGTASPHTVQTTPTPGPPQVRSGRRDGNLPVRIASRAFARRPVSSGIVALRGPARRSCPMPEGSEACSRHPGARWKATPSLLRIGHRRFDESDGGDDRMEHSPTSATGTPRRRDATRDVGGAKTGDHEGEIY